MPKTKRDKPSDQNVNVRLPRSLWERVAAIAAGHPLHPSAASLVEWWVKLCADAVIDPDRDLDHHDLMGERRGLQASPEMPGEGE